MAREDSRSDRHKPIPHVDRFVHLPEHTRKWLESLREDDIDELEEAIKFYHATKTVGKFWKWTIITMVGVFVGAVQFGEAVIKGIGWLFGGRH